VGEEQDEVFEVYEDTRGIGISFSVEDIQGLHAVSVNPGAVRGDHFHERDEALCIMGGRSICEIEIEGESRDSGKKIRVERDMEAFVIPRGCVHRVRNRGERTFFLVSFLIR